MSSVFNVRDFGVSIVAWDDSPLCKITHPTLTALSRDIHALGAHVARRLTDVLASAEPGAHQDTPAHITARGSTAPYVAHDQSR